MAKYRLTRNKTGNYSLSAELLSGRNLVRRFVQVEIAPKDLAATAAALADKVEAHRAKVRSAGGAPL